MIRKKGRKRRVSSIDEILLKTLNKAIKDDPDLRRRLGFLSAGFPEMAEQTTAESRRIRRAEAMIANKALDMIKNDELLKRSMAVALLNQVIAGRTERDSEPNVSMLTEVIAELKKDARSMGIPTTNEIDKLVTPLAIRNALISVQKKQPPEMAALIFALNSGRLDMLTMPRFIRLLKEGKLMPVYLVTAKQETLTGVPGEETKSSPETKPLTEGNHVNLSPDSNAPINLSREAAISPQEFVAQLRAEADAGAVDAGLLFNFLRRAKYNDIKLMLKPYRKYTKLKRLIEDINTDNGKTWIDKVIGLVKEDKQDHDLFDY